MSDESIIVMLMAVMWFIAAMLMNLSAELCTWNTFFSPKQQNKILKFGRLPQTFVFWPIAVSYFVFFFVGNNLKYLQKQFHQWNETHQQPLDYLIAYVILGGCIGALASLVVANNALPGLIAGVICAILYLHEIKQWI